MTSNYLTLNPSKTEFLLIGLLQQTSKTVNPSLSNNEFNTRSSLLHIISSTLLNQSTFACSNISNPPALLAELVPLIICAFPFHPFPLGSSLLIVLSPTHPPTYGTLYLQIQDPLLLTHTPPPLSPVLLFSSI